MFRNTFILKFLFYIVLILFLSCRESIGQSEGHKYTNALINETSPYLLQHAHNPVNWKPWSQEALQEAKENKKLVLISIGYSSCHWCHVMEEETFEDEEVAKMMNENFVNIKVDREERPDVDQVYMTALQLLTGEGGWPLNVITLPNGKPLYGGTYHTKSQWQEILGKITKLYKEDPDNANDYADRLAAGIQEVNMIRPSKNPEDLSEGALSENVEQWKLNWDQEWGGEKGNEKFILPNNLLFLMDYASITGDDIVKDHVKNTLNKIAIGGIYDHLEGGFFRYSTDRFWRIPHFEKMLYDNAQAISLYSKAYKIFKNPVYKEIVYGTINFLNERMKNPEGGYYAAMDADSGGEEGGYYLWTREELESLLGNEFEDFAAYYSINRENELEDNKYSLFRSPAEVTLSDSVGGVDQELKTRRIRWHKTLLQAKKDRPLPSIDDKIIVSWNALLIKGLVDAYHAFDEGTFLDDAASIYEFIGTTMYDGKQLRHSYKKNSKFIAGFLDDYSFLADASLDLYSATLDKKYLDFAHNLTDNTAKEFLDDESGLFQYNSSDELISKIIKMNDGVMPSPNSVMAHNMHRIGHIFYDKASMEKSKNMLLAAAPLLEENPWSYANWSHLLLKTTHPYYEISVVGNNANGLVRQLNQKHLPNTLIVGTETESNIALFEGRYSEDETFIYVCKDNSCKLPVTQVNDALVQLRNF